ncbi:MAG: hypothetical protein HQ501_07450 [Rhodospirillales bacterium]|nr:hypothetical protein [Rhodospirillales bacterium]
METTRHTSWYIAIVLVAAFVTFQIQGIDYGTGINDQPHIKDYVVGSDVSAGSALERNSMTGAGAGESVDRWMVRFKLYSIEADEHINIMALSRIKPGQGQFDPHFYQYGGAWLYPLGAWYLVLSKVGVITLAPLNSYLRQPELMDSVYIWGRVFVVLAVAGASLFLFAACHRIASARESLLCMVLFLAAPGTVMFSQVMKPHWYALFFVCGALYVLTRLLSGQFWRERDNVALGVFLGLAVGSVLTFGLFAALCWLAMAVFVYRGIIHPRALLLVPAIALTVYLGTNPFVVLNISAVQSESSLLVNWYTQKAGISSILLFAKNSLLANFGAAATLLIACVATYAIVSMPRSPMAWAAVTGIGVVVLIAVLTSSIATWHTNTRYLSFLLPSGLLFLCATQWRGQKILLSLAVALTLLQSAPLALAYRDENDPTHSTRHLAGRWIEENIPGDAALCFQTKTLAPYEVPPIDFARYRINDPACKMEVRVEREPDAVIQNERRQLVTRFQPRYSPHSFPLVFSHINPQISVYRYE